MTTQTKSVEERVNEIFHLYDLYGDKEYGEGVTQLMHMVQAAKIAQKEGYDEEMILAAFYHDIGHFLEFGEDMGIYGKHDHDRMGYEYLLDNGFSEKVAKLVASHVATKRYLTYTQKDYYDQLSDASKKTLEYQGGPMTAAEAADYEKDPMLGAYIKIRLWDDLGKETDIPVDPADVAMLKDMTIRYLRRLESKS
ncbi:MAG: HDIG domain-containing protein [Puia sp.]|nr:HDIG domain-containing protein [Puia sp.]